MTEVGKIYETEEEKNSEEKNSGTQMTVYHALGMRKIYNDRMNTMNSDMQEYVDSASDVAETIKGVKRDDYINKLKGNYDRMSSIIRNFYALNAAITQSNAVTTLTIGGVTYTVQEAIVRYDKLNAEIKFLNSISKNLARAKAEVIRNNMKYLSEEAINDYVKTMMASLNLSSEGSDSSSVSEATTSEIKDKLRTEYIQRNTYSLVDPYNLEKTIQEKIEEIETFKNEFNEALNVCNMSTVITVNLVGSDEATK